MNTTFRDRVRAYPGTASQAAFLLGGIGTGNVSVGARGELRDWEIFNWPGKGNYLPFSFFAARVVGAGAEPVTRVLEARLPGPHAKSHGYYNGELAGLPRLAESTMWSTYPFVYVEFRDDELPVRVTMEAFTPFVPGDESDSGIPGAVIRYHVQNPTGADLTVSLVGSLANALGFAGYDVFGNLKLDGNVENERRDSPHCRGLHYTTDLDPSSERFGTIAFATDEENVTFRRAWLQGQWTDNAQDFWDDFASDGRLDDSRTIDAPGSELDNFYDFSYLRLREKVGSIAVEKSIPAGQTATFQFAVTWHVPNRPKGWIEVDDELAAHAAGRYPTIRNHYATEYADAWEVMQRLHRDLPTLEARSRHFTEALYGSTLPDEVIEAVANNITVVRSHTCFWTEDGNFYGWEGIRDHVGCGKGNVNHVWNYAQTIAYLFPALERTMRRIEFQGELDADGALPFRSLQSLGEAKWQMVPAADGQLGAIVRVFREWRLSGDDAFLRDLWPGVDRAMEYALRRWDTDGDAVPDGQQSNTYDIEFYGPNAMMGSLMAAALKACAVMAEAAGDPAKAERYTTLATRSAANLDRLCWNGAFYEQRLDDPDAYRYQFGRGCHSDQLLGQFLAHASGLGHVLPADHVRQALSAIYTNNLVDQMSTVHTVQRVYALNDEPGLVLCSWPEGGRPRFPFGYSDEVWTGVEYQVAASLIYEGLVEEGLTLVRYVRGRHDGFLRNPWSENEAGHHYSRSLSSFALLTALLGFVVDLPGGVMTFAPKATGDFTSFWCHGKGWGVYRQRRDEQGELVAEVEVIEGELGVAEVRTPADRVVVLEWVRAGGR
ncbi:GH116 family glycosyl-hydrolase [Phytohabitans kaempferiae]|uniref:GH116 family glycosyl-hydrolase n=1 Tax=Phytohabitans kaempferiae TaxID=1620943 RepID=A0ABV6MA59_9ACTN